MLAFDPVMQFSHGLYCAVSYAYGCKFWHENEVILYQIFKKWVHLPQRDASSL